MMIEFRRAPIEGVEIVPEGGPRIATSPFREVAEASVSPEIAALMETPGGRQAVINAVFECYIAGPDYFHLGALADEPPPADLVTIDLREVHGEFSLGGELWPGLSKVAEEIGELGQVVGKIIGAEGATIHFDGSDLRERFVEEAADVLAAIDVAIELNALPIGHIQRRRFFKRELFRKWHAERLAERRSTTKLAA
jgi:hypothetical protein